MKAYILISLPRERWVDLDKFSGWVGAIVKEE